MSLLGPRGGMNSWHFITAIKEFKDVLLTNRAPGTPCAISTALIKISKRLSSEL